MTDPQSFLDGKVVLHPGDCRDVVAALPDASIDSVVTDPPYALVSIVKRFGKESAAPAQHGRDGLYARASAGFMGKAWDTGEVAFAVDFWREIFRVLKPGGHVVAFSGTRTYHRMAVAIEDAGFEIRDQVKFDHAADAERAAFLAALSDEQYRQFVKLFAETDELGQLGWAYGTGFPKSHDVSKGIDKAAGAARRVVAEGAPVKRMIPGADQHKAGWEKSDGRVYLPQVTEPATAAAGEWQGWGTALKPAWEPICMARKPLIGTVAENVLAHGAGALNIDGCRVGDETLPEQRAGQAQLGTFERAGMVTPERTGRWPANIVHDGSDEVLAAFPTAPGQQGGITGSEPSSPFMNVYGDMPSRVSGAVPRGDSGSAARFFYSAKADDDDRIGSRHPTVKPVDLMRWLCRLVTPPGGVVLDPFAGTGTTGAAAFLEGFLAVLVEREAEYQADIARRMELVLAGPDEKRHAVIKAKGKVEPPGGLFAGLDEAAS